MQPTGIRCLLIVALLVPWAAGAASNADRLHAFFSQSYEERLRDEPEMATFNGRHDYDDRWNDWSTGGRTARRTHLEARLRELAAIPLDDVSDEDRLSARLFRYAVEQDLAADDLETHLIRVGQLYGFHNRIYQMIDRMPTRTVGDYENVIARLRAVPAYVTQNMGVLQEGMDRGLTQPPVVVDRVVEQLSKQVSQGPDDSALLAGFRRFPGNLPDAEQARLRAAAVKAYVTDFLPAWTRLRDFIDGPYRSKARVGVGLGTLPNGHEAYATMVRRLTTTTLAPKEIHAIGIAEVARIETAMQQAARDVGFTGTLDEFAHQLRDSPEQHFRSKDEMLAYCRNLAKIIEPELPGQFKRIPVLLYGVRAIPEDREQATASNAQAPAADGSAPGWFNLNAYQPDKQFRFDKDALVLHEAVPGHIFQISVARSTPNLPEFRKYYGNSAYLEGWALYAESLGAQLGVYRDPYSRFGQLSSERLRAVRLVVDTGMHELGWSRDQALEYFRTHAPESSLAEIDRYISWPGQALAYKLGQLEILRLRREAEQRLGPKFDVRDFHDVVLRDGVLPLELLREQVEKYINGAHQ
ncbi:MAG TPA: DUF885 domain-containing protein [Steroidobacteraceae bacterium]|nr:DUF885 domain-containing protein [Steroidobacteraceae bacterium]